MSAPAAQRLLPRPFAAACAYALRICVPPKRAVLLALPCAGALLFGLLARTVEEPTPAARFNTISGALFGLILPLARFRVQKSQYAVNIHNGLYPVGVFLITFVLIFGKWAIQATDQRGHLSTGRSTHNGYFIRIQAIILRKCPHPTYRSFHILNGSRITRFH